MRKFVVRAAAALACGVAAIGVAQAQELRPFCADRPGLGTPACTLDKGRVAVELGGADWTLERDASQRIDTLIAGDLLVRVGVTDTLEAQIGWTGFGHVRVRDKITGAVSRSSGTGDVSVALRQNLMSPDGSGFSVALMPFASLPTGGATIGAGDWGAGLVVPISYELSDGIAIGLSPSVEAATDGDGRGRHAAYGTVIGLSASLTETVGTALEFQATRDEDPSGHNTQALASLSFAWAPQDGLQFDMGVVGGLNDASPDLEVYVGVARRF
ncbi:MAG: transporter [Sphingomonadales bacterium]|nr:MAG: transporter [Sphingomonadales bacterium]